MTLKTNAYFRTTSLLALISCAFSAQSLPAQEMAVNLEEIVVTAQKRSENLQDVPIAISAFSGDALEASSIIALDEVSTRTPGFTMTRYNMAQPQLFIRGIGSTDDSASGDQSVGIFVDEVYVGRAGGTDFDLMDLERVEILRGPQGTLYGKNVVGGAINIITRKPSAETQVKFQGTYGNYDRYELRGLVNGALSDNVNAKLSLSKVERDGHSISSIDGSRLGDENNFSARGQVLFSANEDLEILLSADYSRDRLAGNSRDCFGEQFVFFPWFAPGQPLGASPCSEDPFVNEKTVNGYQDRDIWGVSGKVTWQTAIGEITSITAYRSSEFDYQEDFSGSDANLVINNVDEEADQFSQELRLGDVTDDGKLKWLVGVYYLNERINRLDNNDFRGNDAAVAVTPSPVPGLTWGQLLPLTGQPWGQAPFNIFYDQRNTTNSYAAFGQATYTLNDVLSLTLGARYTHESKDARINAYGFDPTGSFLAAPYDVAPSESWNAFTPKATLDYRINEDAMIYVSYSEGFKSGGFNGSASSEASALSGFDPEKAKQWEGGLKSMLLDGKVRLNLTAFHIDYSDLQVFQLVNGSELVIDNAADAKSKGFEAELTAALTRELRVSANYAYLDATYSSYVTAEGNDLSGNRLTRSPKNSFNFSMNYSREIGGWGRITLQGDYSYRDEIFFNPDNYRLDDGRILVGDGNRSLVDAYIALQFIEQGLEVKAWGKNLTDERYRVHGIDGRGPFNLSDNSAVIYGMPRTYGLTLTWRYN